MVKKKSSQIEDCVQDAARFLSSLANEKRLLILCSLLDGERCVSELLEELPLSQSLLSQHLKVLKAEAVLSSRREAQRIYYSLADKTALKVLEALERRFRRA